jgi:hypothetical protein
LLIVGIVTLVYCLKRKNMKGDEDELLDEDGNFLYSQNDLAKIDYGTAFDAPTIPTVDASYNPQPQPHTTSYGYTASAYASAGAISAVAV